LGDLLAAREVSPERYEGVVGALRVRSTEEPEEGLVKGRHEVLH